MTPASIAPSVRPRRYLFPLGRLKRLEPEFIAWAVIAFIVKVVTELPLLPALQAEFGFALALFGLTYPSFVAAVILTIGVRISMHDGSDMARHPARFLTVMAIGSAISIFLIWTGDGLFDLGLYALEKVIHKDMAPRAELLPIMLDDWCAVMLWGSFFGWAAILYLRKTEEQRNLSALLLKRATFARQIAQSRLLTARAQIDPEMIARVLNTARQRYRTHPEQGSLLIDRLINYLRLAMGRNREEQLEHTHSSLEIALFQAYILLLETELGITISLQIPTTLPNAFAGKNSVALLFPFLRELAEEGINTQTANPTIRMRLEPGHQIKINIQLTLLDATLPPISLDSLQTSLNTLPNRPTLNQRSLGPGAHCYVVDVSL